MPFRMRACVGTLMDTNQVWLLPYIAAYWTKPYKVKTLQFKPTTDLNFNCFFFNALFDRTYKFAIFLG